MKKEELIVKALTFATYWLMVFAVFSGISSYDRSLSAESEAVTDAAEYSVDDVDCDAGHGSGHVAGVASVRCVN